MRESKLEDLVQDWCEANGVLCIKFTPMGENGWPDRIFGRSGRACWIELKATGKKARKLQQHRLEQLRLHGFIAECHDNLEDCIKTLRAALFPRGGD